ncbi:hypothetical protein D9M72_441100 [compost metagenome]
MRVLIACEYSGVVRSAFARRGHTAVSCDLLPTDNPHGWHIRGDVLKVLDQGWDLMIAHPTCTRLTNSGVRWLHEPPPGKTKEQMWAELKAAAEFYCALRDAPIPMKAIENPIMHKYARELIKPGARQVVQPYWFGVPEFKATGLELIGLPQLRPTQMLTPPKSGTDEHKAWSIVHRESRVLTAGSAAALPASAWLKPWLSSGAMPINSNWRLHDRTMCKGSRLLRNHRH